MRIVNGIELDDGVDEPGAYEWHDSPDEYQPYHKPTPCKNNPMHICDDGCATECRLWRQAKPTERHPLTEAQQRAVGTECGPYCTPDDHLRYADRGKCMLCGREFNPPNADVLARGESATPTTLKPQ